MQTHQIKKLTFNHTFSILNHYFFIQNNLFFVEFLFNFCLIFFVQNDFLACLCACRHASFSLETYGNALCACQCMYLIHIYT